MAKIKENWLSILLAVVVILSMIFSALLWTNSLGYEWIANNDSEKGASQQTARYLSANAGDPNQF